MAKREKVIFTDKEKVLILGLFEIGLSEREIAHVLHMPKSTFHDSLENNTLIGHIKKGVADEKVRMSLYNQAMKGNVTALIFWLCNRKPNDWHNVNKTDMRFSGGVDITIKYKKPETTKKKG